MRVRFFASWQATAAAAVNGGYLPLPPVSLSLITHQLHPLLETKNIQGACDESSLLLLDHIYHLHRNGPLEAASFEF